MNFEKMVAYRNEKNLFARRLGIVVQEIAPGYGRVTKTITAEDVNPLGAPHGGVYFTLADTACGSAATTHGYASVTLSSNYNFFRSASIGDVLTAEAREVKCGSTIHVYEVAVSNQDGKLLGNGTFTFYQLDKPLEIDQ